MPLGYPSQEEILENLSLFQTTFIQHFQALLKISYNQANGLQEVKEGKKAGLVGTALEWTRDAFGAVPVFGSFVSLGLKVPETINRKKDEKNQKNKAKHIASMTTGMDEGLDKGIVEEAARELARIYEYQIGLLAGEKEVKNLAKYAATIAVSHYSHVATIKDPNLNVFDRNNIVEAVVNVEKRYGIGKEIFTKGKPTLKTCIAGLEWEVPSIFTKPGIRKLNLSTNTIECFDIEGSRPKKYGYRAEVRRYVPEKGSYIDSELDDVSKLKASSSSNVDADKQKRYEFHQGYSARSIYMLVSRKMFKQYCKYLAGYSQDEKQAPLSFNVFLRDAAGRETDMSLRAVYRDRPLIDTRTLHRADFSETDFSGIRIEKLTAEKAQFNKAYFIHTLFRHCTFIGASFKKANCWQAVFEENNNLQNANVVSSNFGYVTFSEDTNFSVSRSEGAIFVSSNLHEVTQVGANFDETAITIVKEEAEKRDKELEEKIKLLEEKMEQAKGKGEEFVLVDQLLAENGGTAFLKRQTGHAFFSGKPEQIARFQQLMGVKPEDASSLPSSTDNTKLAKIVKATGLGAHAEAQDNTGRFFYHFPAEREEAQSSSSVNRQAEPVSESQKKSPAPPQ